MCRDVSLSLSFSLELIIVTGGGAKSDDDSRAPVRVRFWFQKVCGTAPGLPVEWTAVLPHSGGERSQQGKSSNLSH